MLVSFTDIRSFPVYGRDDGEQAELGRLVDIYIDTRDWRIDWLVLETGGWFDAHRVLLGTDRPLAFDIAERCVRTEFLRYDIETAADASSLRTVSDREGGHFGAMPPGPGPWLAGSSGMIMPSSLAFPGSGDDDDSPPSEEERQLRSAAELVGYSLHGSDGDVGTVRDLVVDGDSPRIAWLSIDTGSWLTGRETVIAPSWADSISFAERTVTTGLSRKQVRDAPLLDSLEGLDRTFVSALASHYRLPLS